MSASKKRDIAILSLGLLLGAGLGLLFLRQSLGLQDWFNPGQNGSDSGRAGASVGSPAPDFELDNLAGQKVRLSDFSGQPVLINFWATWCGPCKLEMPAIQSRYDRFTPDFVVLGVNASESIDLVRDYTESMNISFEILLDTRSEVQSQYLVYAFPISFFIDRDGIVQFQHVGLLSETQLDSYLAELGVGQ